jgi:hypothetical protein
MNASSHGMDPVVVGVDPSSCARGHRGVGRRPGGGLRSTAAPRARRSGTAHGHGGAAVVGRAAGCGTAGRRRSAARHHPLGHAGRPLRRPGRRGPDGRARMLVLGSYGDGASSGMLAGSLALALLDRVTCPVAVLRGSSPQVPPPGTGPVVVGVDGSVAGRVALTFAADLAGSWAAPLVAVHTWADVVDGSTAESAAPRTRRCSPRRPTPC